MDYLQESEEESEVVTEGFLPRVRQMLRKQPGDKSLLPVPRNMQRTPAQAAATAIPVGQVPLPIKPPNAPSGNLFGSGDATQDIRRMNQRRDQAASSAQAVPPAAPNPVRPTLEILDEEQVDQESLEPADMSFAQQEADAPDMEFTQEEAEAADMEFGQEEADQPDMSFSMAEAEQQGSQDQSDYERRIADAGFDSVAAFKRSFDQQASQEVDPEVRMQREGQLEDKYLSAMEQFSQESPSLQAYREAYESGTASPEELDRLYQNHRQDQEKFEALLMQRGTRMPGGGTDEEMLQRVREMVAPHRAESAEESGEGGGAQFEVLPYDNMRPAEGEQGDEAQDQAPTEEERRAEQQRARYRRYAIAQALRGLGGIGMAALGADTSSMGQSIEGASQAYDAETERQATALREAAERAEARRRDERDAGFRERTVAVQESRNQRDAATDEEEAAERERLRQPATDEQKAYYLASLPADVRERMRDAIMSDDYTVGQGEALLEKTLRDNRASRRMGGNNRNPGGVGGGGGGDDRSPGSMDPNDWNANQIGLYNNLGIDGRRRFMFGYRPPGWFGEGSEAIQVNIPEDRLERMDTEVANLNGRVSEAQQGNVERRSADRVIARSGGSAIRSLVGPQGGRTAYSWTGPGEPNEGNRAEIRSAIAARNALGTATRRYRENSDQIAELARSAGMSDQAIASGLRSGGFAATVANFFRDQNNPIPERLAQLQGRENGLRQGLIGAIRDAENWGAQTLGEQALAASQLPSTPGWSLGGDVSNVALGVVMERARVVNNRIDNTLSVVTERVPNQWVVNGEQPRSARALRARVIELQQAARGSGPEAQQARQILSNMRITRASGGRSE